MQSCLFDTGNNRFNLATEKLKNCFDNRMGFFNAHKLKLFARGEAKNNNDGFS